MLSLQLQIAGLYFLVRRILCHDLGEQFLPSCVFVLPVTFSKITPAVLCQKTAPLVLNVLVETGKHVFHRHSRLDHSERPGIAVLYLHHER